MKKKTLAKKISVLQCILSILSVSLYLASNIITGRQIQLPFNITFAGAVLIFPFTYILSDVFSEVYGYKWSRITNWVSFAIQILVVAIFTITLKLPYPAHFTAAEAYDRVLGNTPFVLIGSLLAFVIGDWVNDKVFDKMKKKHPKSLKGFSLRAILSSFAGEFADSLIFIPIAFGITGAMPAELLPKMMLVSAIRKVLHEIILLPVTTFAVKKINQYENGDATYAEEES